MSTDSNETASEPKTAGQKEGAVKEVAVKEGAVKEGVTKENVAPASSRSENTRESKVDQSKGDQKPRRDFLEAFASDIVENYNRANDRLRTVLAGSLELFVRDRPFRVVFDFTSVPCKIIKDADKTPDCTIELDERTLSRLAQGELNTQLAMLSEKVNIRGKAGMAVYFFNLVASE